MEEIITFSGRGHGGTGSRIGRVTKLVKPFWPIQKEANSESISIKHSRYSERRIEAGMEAIIENLMKEPEGTWVSRVTLKQRSRSSVGDTGLLNFSLRCVENRRVGDSMIVRRSIHPVSQVMAYRLERVSSNPDQPPPVCEERRAPDPKPPRKGGDPSAGESKREKGGKPRPVRPKKEPVLEERNLTKEELEEAEFEEGLSTLFALEGEIRPLPAMVDGQAVNLLSLYQHVSCNGGYHEVSKRREWNDVAAQMGLKLEAGPCLKLLHAKYLLNLEALLGDLSPPSQAPKAMSLPEQGPQKTRSSSTCTSERGQGRLKESGRDFGRGDEREPVSQGGGEGERHSGGGDERDRRSGGDDDVRTTLPSLRAVSEGSLGQHAESEECMETDATSSACSLKVEEVTGGTKEGLREGFGAFQAGLEEVSGGVKVGFGTLQRDGLQNYEGVSQGARESLAGVREDLLKGLGAGVRGEISKGERVSIDLGPETSVEGSLLTDAIPSVRSAGGKRSLTESELFGGVSFIESLAVRKSGVYGSGSVSEVSGSADVAGARGEGNAEPLAVPTGEGAVPTARDQNGGANLLEDDPAQPVGVPDWRRGVAEGGPVPFPGDESSFRGFGGLRALTVSLQGLDGLGPQDASELEHWLGENRRNDSTVSWGEQRPAHTPANPTTLSPQRLQLIQNPSPRKMHLSPRMMNPSPRNLTLSPSKWMHSLSGQKRKAGLLCATQFGGVEDAGFVQGLETPEAKRRREVATGHPLRRPRGYRPLTSYADPVPPQLTATVTALQEQLQRHRENWLVVRLESVAEEGRRTRTKLVEEELEYLQPRIGSRFQASVPEWRPFMGAKTVAQTVLHPSGDLATPPGDDLLTSEATWISRLVWRPLQEPTAAEEERVAVPVMVADPRLTRPSLRRTSSQSDGAAVRKQLVSDARSALEVTLGGAGGDLGLTEMGERVAGKWSRAEEQRFVATAGSIRRGKDVSEDFFGEGFFRAIREAVPERLLTELVSYYYNVYKVRCKRGVVRLKGGLGKVDVDGAAKPPGTVQSAGAERDQVLDAGPRGSAFESRGARATDLYVED